MVPTRSECHAMHPAGSTRRGPLDTAALADIAAGLAAVAEAQTHDAVPGDGVVSRQRILSTSGYDAWLVQWGVGAVVDSHDHDGSVGVIHVVQGELVEDWLDPTGGDTIRTRLPAGALTEFGVDLVHRLENLSAGVTTTVQVFSPPLGQDR